MSGREAGRELDALVAEHVMGLPDDGNSIQFGDNPPHRIWPPPYSTEIRAAWEVVEKINARGEWITVGFNAAHVPACFISSVDAIGFVKAEAETAPLAICRAALQAASEW